jgi:hypothetical protein
MHFDLLAIRRPVMKPRRYVMIGVLLLLGVQTSQAWALETNAFISDALAKRLICKRALNGDIFSRTELFFGLSRNLGPDITEEEFQWFIDTEVTPQFPDGLTLVTAKGQYRNVFDEIIQEDTKVLILLYPFSLENSRAVDEIRETYIDLFQQESVLRLDQQSCVSF